MNLKKIKTQIKQFFCQHMGTETTSTYDTEKDVLLSRTICSECGENLPTPMHLHQQVYDNFMAQRRG